MLRKFNVLTPKQKRAYEEIKKFIESHGESPTIRELQTILKVRYLRSVIQFLDFLEEKGFIKRTPNEPRGIQILKFSESVSGTSQIPVVGSAGCDDVSVFAEPSYDDYVSIDNTLLKDPEKTVVIQAVGNSMESSGISDGDYVLVELTEYIKDNDRVAVIIDGMAVIKRINFTKSAVVLNPDSPDGKYKPIILKEKPKIIGRVIDVIQTKSDDVEFLYENYNRNQ